MTLGLFQGFSRFASVSVFGFKSLGTKMKFPTINSLTSGWVLEVPLLSCRGVGSENRVSHIVQKERSIAALMM